MHELTLLLQLVLAVLLGGLIGFEREKDLQPAGFRTHIVVTIAATFIMSVFLAFFTVESSARITAAVITGIGFIGAGTIISQGGAIRGLTTAATIWSVAGIGMVIGAGLYLHAVIIAAVIFGVLQLKFVDEWVHQSVVKKHMKSK